GCPHSQHKDIYLEVDYVGGTSGVSTTALSTALEDIRQTFNSAPVPNSYGGNGIKFHYFIDENIGTTSSKKNVDVWTNRVGDTSTSNDFNKLKDDWFGTFDERGGTNHNIPSDATRARFQAFHYALFSLIQNQDPGSSGNAETVGNDIIVTLGSFDSGKIDNVDQIRGTLMHEVGHNLGLYHGGPSTVTGYNVNCKPNYPSVMTYIRQITGAYGTQQYSDSVNDPASLDMSAGLYDSAQGSVLKIGGDSAASSLTIVWSIDEGINKPTDTITKSASNINWQNLGTEPDNPDSDYLHILDLGITGCSHATNSHGSIIYGADDWEGIEGNLNFREINPTHAESGFPEGYFPDDELDHEMLTELQVMGLESSYYLIQSIPTVDYRPPYNNSTAETLIEKEMKCRLLDETNNGTNTCSNFFVPNTVSPKSVADLIRANDMVTAVKKLEEIRTVMDDERGGFTKDDLFSSTTTYTPIDPPAEPIILPMLDNNIASLKLSELNLPFQAAVDNPGVVQSFKLVTYDGGCEELSIANSSSYGKNCILTGSGETIVNSTSTFAYDKNNLLVDLEGTGSVSMEVPMYLVKNVNDVIYADSGNSIPFMQVANQSTGEIGLNFTTGWYPRLINIQHDMPAVNASVSTDHCGGRYHTIFPYANQNSTFYVTLDNNNPTNFSGEVTISVRNAGNHSVFEDAKLLNMTGKESLCILFDWPTPNPDVDSGTYNLEVRVEDDSVVSVTRSKLFINDDP
ncbi:MAG TPA: hypothetical protein VJP79_08955, partial [Nitrososphaera sp.]|nr:hypothetical protein [Nitrososphaera sp.]